jgi:hypothetical protein
LDDLSGGFRNNVPAALAGGPVRVRITLDGVVAIYDGEQCVAQDALQPSCQGWVTVPDHHAALRADTLAVERRPLAGLRGGGVMELTVLLERMKRLQGLSHRGARGGMSAVIRAASRAGSSWPSWQWVKNHKAAPQHWSHWKLERMRGYRPRYLHCDSWRIDEAERRLRLAEDDLQLRTTQVARIHCRVALIDP